MPLIVLEGIDGSGKSTQLALLSEHMDRLGLAYIRLQFHQYDKPSSAPLRMYLNGDFGTDPGSVGPYAASTFFAVDRYASYKTDWGEAYGRGGTILADRYVSSNAVHQGSKLLGEERTAFFRWLDEFEHVLMELPRPDIVLYMDVPIELALENVRVRQVKTGAKVDIHEAGEAYLRTCAEAAREAAQFYGWHLVPCSSGGQMRSPVEIHREVLSILRDMMPSFGKS